MICGLGIDIIGIERIRSLLTRHQERFLARWFDPREAAYILTPGDAAGRAAARWAAKEAAAKALGCGFADGVVPSQIAVLPGPSGAPVIELLGAAKARAETLGATRWLCSLSHADGMAVAVVVLES